RRIDVGFEQSVQRFQRVLHGDPVVRHWEGYVKDLGHHWSETRFVRLDFARQADTHERTAVEAAGESDDRRALRVIPGDLHRVFDGLSARGQEDRLLRRLTRCYCVELLGKLDVAFVRRDLKAGMSEFLELGGNGRLDLRVQVPCVEHGNAGPEVDIPLAFNVPQLRVRS